MLKLRLISVLLTLPALLCFGTRVTAQEAALPASSINLEVGDCALFIWVGYPSRLLFISQAEDRIAYSAEYVGKRYSISPNRAADKFGQYADQDFLGQGRELWQIRLDVPTELPESLFYKSGSITLPAPDGWLRVENAQAVSACNNTGFGSALSLDENTGGFTPPHWLETPAQLSQKESAGPKTAVVAVVAEPEAVPEPLIIQTPEAAPEPPLVMVETTTPLSVEIEAPTLINASYVSVEPESVTEVVPEPVIAIAPVHTVQLGAYRNEALARQAWENLQIKANYLQEKESIVQLADVKGQGEIYRLRVTGFPDRTGAVDFCWRLQSNMIDCYVPGVK